LHLASHFGRVKVVLVLLDAGANSNAKNAQGQTPLHLVSQSPYYSQRDGVNVTVAQLLLEHGADVNVQDKNHATPSDIASYHGRTEIASLLLHYGGKANAKTDQYLTLCQLRFKCDDKPVATVLGLETWRPDLGPDSLWEVGR